MALKKRFFLEYEHDYIIAEDMKNPPKFYFEDKHTIYEDDLDIPNANKKNGRKGKERGRER